MQVIIEIIFQLLFLILIFVFVKDVEFINTKVTSKEMSTIFQIYKIFIILVDNNKIIYDTIKENIFILYNFIYEIINESFIEICNCYYKIL